MAALTSGPAAAETYIMGYMGAAFTQDTELQTEVEVNGTPFVNGDAHGLAPAVDELEESDRAVRLAVGRTARVRHHRELLDLGIGDRTAREMDHLPIGGAGGSLE